MPQMGSFQAGMPGWRLLRIILVCVALAGGDLTSIAAFSDENWISMGGLPGANDTVYASTTDSSGNLYVAGDFTLIGETLANHVAKWNGTGWTALGSGVNGRVYAL